MDTDLHRGETRELTEQERTAIFINNRKRTVYCDSSFLYTKYTKDFGKRMDRQFLKNKLFQKSYDFMLNRLKKT